MPIEKWTGPLKDPPPWLDLAAEVKGPEPARLSRDLFPVFCVDTLLSLGCPLRGALEIAANAIVETGWGQQFRAWNLGGVKATQSWARAYRQRTGRSAPWWRAHGNKSSGDSQTVFYRGYVDAKDFFDEWLHTFVPKPGSVTAAHLYRDTGELFWAGDSRWFAALIQAGYKGSVTKRSPARSISDHASLTKSVLTRWAQSRLKVSVDGQWGPRSRKACEDFQRSKALPVTGEPDDRTLEMLVSE